MSYAPGVEGQIWQQLPTSCTGTTTVAVPHDQAHPAVGGGPLYDSTRR